MVIDVVNCCFRSKIKNVQCVCIKGYLLPMLGDTNQNVRKAVLKAVIALKPRGLEVTVRKLLQSDSQEEKGWGITLYSECGLQAVGADVLDSLETMNKDNRVTALTALSRMN